MHGLLVEVLDDEDQARPPIVVGPTLQLRRWMEHMLDRVHDHRIVGLG